MFNYVNHGKNFMAWIFGGSGGVYPPKSPDSDSSCIIFGNDTKNLDLKVPLTCCNLC